MRWASVFFMSSEKTGFVHPCGDGYRKLLAYEREDGTITALYPPTLEAATYTPEVWASFRANMDTIEAPGEVRVRLLARREEMRRVGVPIAQTETGEALDLLAALMPPPPAPRARTRFRRA